MREIKTKIETVIITYESEDGVSFNDIDECIEYEVSRLTYRENGKVCEVPPINLDSLDGDKYFEWYCIENVNDLKALNDRFKLGINENIKLPEYICVETFDKYDFYPRTYSECKKDIVKFLAHFNLDKLNEV